MQNSFDWAGVKSSILYGNDFQVSLEGSPYWEDLSKFPVVQGNAPPLIDCP